MRIEPPMSDPVAKVEVPLARDAAVPPDEPPGVYARFHGLRVVPCNLVLVVTVQENSGVAVRVCTIAPAFMICAFTGDVVGAMKSLWDSDPNVVGNPLIKLSSLTDAAVNCWQ